jgi:hypothetical protein
MHPKIRQIGLLPTQGQNAQPAVADALDALRGSEEEDDENEEDEDFDDSGD